MARQRLLVGTLVFFGIILLAILGITITILIGLLSAASHMGGPHGHSHGGPPEGPPQGPPNGPPNGIPTGLPNGPPTGLPSQRPTKGPTKGQTTLGPTQPPCNTTDDTKSSPEFDRFAASLYSRVNFSVDPCEDFYEYSCGLWPYSNPVPSYLASWTEYTKVSMQVSRDVKDAMENADMTTSSEGVKKAKRFYDECMDVNSTEALKGTKLAKLLHSGFPEDPSLPGLPYGRGKWPIIDTSYGALGTEKWEVKIGQLKKSFGIDTFLLAYALQYDLQSNKTVLWLTGQMLPLGLGLFAFDYYLNPKHKDVMDAYQQMQKEVALLIARDSGFVNVNITQEDLDGMLNVEKQLANLTRMSLSEQNDALWTMEDLKNNVSSTFDWDKFFKNLLDDDSYQKVKAGGDPVVQLNTPKFLKNVIDLINASKDRDLQNYAIWRLVKYSVPYLSSEYTAALKKFNDVYKGNASDETPRADICLSYIKGNFELPNLGFASAEAYSRKFFSEDMRQNSRDLVVSVKGGLQNLIKAADWMDNQTRANALDKAVKMDMMIAYPDWTMNKTAMKEYYSRLEIPENVSFISLNLMLRSWAVLKNFDDILVPVDRRDFVGSPIRTDAWYTATRNSFTMPIGELQYPFYGYEYPNAMNYGAIGAVAGHEMSHGFDVQGSQFDADGNQHDWWSPESKKEFQKRTQCLIDQFNNYCFKGVGCINGSRTVAENTADLGGLKAAYEAYKALPAEPRLAKAPMFSDDQLFFLSFSSFYCGSDNNAATESQLVTNSHSPPKYRVIGTLRNIPEFAKAFSCKKNSYMNPEQRCSVW
uniref:Neprilysin n=1 Tax=Steinernema glaseri TaxID=37863 RepID=A0A1I8AJR9_9BILA